MSFLELKDITKSYKLENGELSVLKNINLSIKENELLTVVGPTGCGKSTLLSLLAGFLRPDTGKIVKGGRLVSSPDIDRIMIFQEFEQLFPWKTVLGNVIFPLKAKKIASSKKERELIAEKYLRKVKMEEFRDYYPYQLSGGMKQRTALARALVTKPEILLMDEPFGSLDSQTRDSLQEMLLEVWDKENITIIFVTHDIREAIVLADRIVVLGRKTGTSKEIINNNLPRPRDRTGVGFNELYERIYSLL